MPACGLSRGLSRQVLDSEYRRRRKMTNRHIAIGTWLDALHMPQYAPLFQLYGGVEDLVFIDETELYDLGITDTAHRAKIAASLRVLRDKFITARANGSGALTPQRNPSLVNLNCRSYDLPELDEVIASPEKLQRDLELELSSDSGELRSHAWYHGSLPRGRAEQLVTGREGNFLVRDCLSQPGDLVLTCCWRNAALNFLINADVGACVPGQLPPLSYRFEEDSFPTIQQLITSYRARGKPVTVASGARIIYPVHRTVPLSCYDTKFGARGKRRSSTPESPGDGIRSDPFSSNTKDTAEMNRRNATWTGSQPTLTSLGSDSVYVGGQGGVTITPNSRAPLLDRCDSLPMISVTPPSSRVNGNINDNSDSHKINRNSRKIAPPVTSHMRSGSVPILAASQVDGRARASSGRLNSASSEGELYQPPPPKPSRIPSVKLAQRPHVVIRRIQDDDDDRDYSDYDHVKEKPSWVGGASNSAPKFRESPAPAQTSAAPRQVGRRAQRLARGGKGISPSSKSSAVSRKPSSVTSPPVMRHHDPPNFQSDLRREARIYMVNTEEDEDDDDDDSPPLTPTYKIVARSRSFRHPRRDEEDYDDDDYDNNFGNSGGGNSMHKGYQTLPNRSSKAKFTRSRKVSDQSGSFVIDYDVPKSRDPDVYNTQFQNIINNNNNNDNNYNFGLYLQPPQSFVSALNPETFTSDLLPDGHKVLDQNVLLTIKDLLLRKSSKDLAMTLTCYDLHLFRVTCTSDLCLGVTSGLELLTLPQGQHLRADGLERWECLRLFVCATLLACQGINERAQLLAQWIYASQDLGAIGNQYSQAAILSGLTGEPVRRLTDTWMALRRGHTSAALNFDRRLRPALAALNNATAELPVNEVTVPYVTPACRLLQALGPAVSADVTIDSHPKKTVPASLNINSGGVGGGNNTNNTSKKNSHLKNIGAEHYWEVGLDPVGGALDVLLTHLDTARVVAAQAPLYRQAGQALMSTFTPDPGVWAALRPELHLRILWGGRGWSKGWGQGQAARVSKLEQVLAVLSQRCQLSEDDGTEV